MTAAFSARRRADEFEGLLSRDPGSPLSERDAERYGDLLALVGDLRAVPEVAPRPEFTASLREQLMAEADTVLERRPSSSPFLAMPPSTRSRDRRRAAVLGGVALVGATATMAVAAQTALPGEALYGVKRGIESAQVRLSGDDAARGRTLLSQADTRLTELEELATDGSDHQQLVSDTLDSFNEQSGEGVGDLLDSYASSGAQQDAELARSFTASSLERLDALQYALPEASRDDLVAAGRALTDLDAEISAACPACDSAVTTTPDLLLSGAPVTDLLSGLDSDTQTLEAAPVSGQDLTGIVVPEELQSPGLPSGTATSSPSSPVASATSALPTKAPSGSTKSDPTKPLKDLTGEVTGPVGEVTGALDQATGGAVGGLAGDLDNATGGLISEVTGTLDDATGGLVSDTTGGLLP